MNDRVKKIQQKLRKLKLDAYWCCHEGNRRYLSGFSGSNGWLVIPARGKATIITDGRYTEQAKEECPDWIIVDETKDMLILLKETLYKSNVKKLVIEENIVSVANWASIKKMIKGLQGCSSRGMVEQQRLFKDSNEIKYIKKAVSIADCAYKKVFPQIKTGITEINLALLLEKTMMETGGEGIAFPTIVASGKNSALPHAKPTRKQIKKGDLVVLDFGCIYKGYHSDLTRTIAIARMSDKQHEIYKIVKKAQVSAQKLLFSGQMSADSDKKAREVFRSEKTEQFFVHSLGHGLGLEIHEGPRLSIKAKEKLGSGMVVTCEPGIYIPGWGGIRIEDDILINDDDSEWLSKSSLTLPVADQ